MADKKERDEARARASQPAVGAGQSPLTAVDGTGMLVQS